MPLLPWSQFRSHQTLAAAKADAKATMEENVRAEAVAKAKANALAEAEARGKAKRAAEVKAANAEAEEKHEALIDRMAKEVKVRSQDMKQITYLNILPIRTDSLSEHIIIAYRYIVTRHQDGPSGQG